LKDNTSIFSLPKRVIRKKIKQTLFIKPSNIQLYQLAFTHRSVSIKASTGERLNNERLEFLGDRAIDLVVSEHLYRLFPQKKEGEIVEHKNRLVRRKNLNKIAYNLRLQDFLIFSGTYNFENTNILGNAFEALMGAIFLDKGYNGVKKYFDILVKKGFFDLKFDETRFNFKGELYEWATQNKHHIRFETEQKNNANTMFQSTLFIDNKPIATASAKSKKEAEQIVSDKGEKILFKDS